MNLAAALGNDPSCTSILSGRFLFAIDDHRVTRAGHTSYNLLISAIARLLPLLADFGHNHSIFLIQEATDDLLEFGRRV